MNFFTHELGEFLKQEDKIYHLQKEIIYLQQKNEKLIQEKENLEEELQLIEGHITKCDNTHEEETCLISCFSCEKNFCSGCHHQKCALCRNSITLSLCINCQPTCEFCKQPHCCLCVERCTNCERELCKECSSDDFFNYCEQCNHKYCEFCLGYEDHICQI